MDSLSSLTGALVGSFNGELFLNAANVEFAPDRRSIPMVGNRIGLRSIRAIRSAQQNLESQAPPPDYTGATMVDCNGVQVGQVARSYGDERGRTRLVQVDLGSEHSSRYRFVPLDDSRITANSIKAPYRWEIIERSPPFPQLFDAIDAVWLEELRDYYARSAAVSAASSAATENLNPSSLPPEVKAQIEPAPVQPVPAAIVPDANADAENTVLVSGVRDLGDVIEVPIVEEVLVKKQVVKEIIRIHKSQVTEQQMVEANLRKEEVEVQDRSNP